MRRPRWGGSLLDGFASLAEGIGSLFGGAAPYRRPSFMDKTDAQHLQEDWEKVWGDIGAVMNEEQDPSNP